MESRLPPTATIKTDTVQYWLSAKARPGAVAVCRKLSWAVAVPVGAQTTTAHA